METMTFYVVQRTDTAEVYAMDQSPHVWPPNRRWIDKILEALWFNDEAEVSKLLDVLRRDPSPPPVQVVKARSTYEIVKES